MVGATPTGLPPRAPASLFCSCSFTNASAVLWPTACSSVGRTPPSRPAKSKPPIIKPISPFSGSSTCSPHKRSEGEILRVKPQESKAGGLFGDLDVRLDPWYVDYGSELPLEADEPPAEDVVLDVELPPGEWTPLTPPPIAPPRLVFVDGVRRIEARLVVRRGDRVAHGAFGSFAVGSVVAGGGDVAACGEIRMQRLVATG